MRISTCTHTHARTHTHTHTCTQSLVISQCIPTDYSKTKIGKFPRHKNYKQHFTSFTYASATCHGLKNQIFWDMTSHSLPIDKATYTRRCESSSTSLLTPPRCGISIDRMQLAKQHQVFTLALTWSSTMNRQTMMNN